MEAQDRKQFVSQELSHRWRFCSQERAGRKPRAEREQNPPHDEVQFKLHLDFSVQAAFFKYGTYSKLTDSKLYLSIAINICLSTFCHAF